MLGGFAPLPLRLVADDLRGLSAAQHARLCTDLRSAVEAAPFAVITGSWTLSTATITSYLGQNGVGLAAAPAIVDIGSGFRELTWAAAYTDDYGIVTGTRIKHAIASINATAEAYISPTVTDPLNVRLRGFGATGSTLVNASWTLVVY